MRRPRARRVLIGTLAAAALLLTPQPVRTQAAHAQDAHARAAPDYAIQAIRYATVPDFPLSGLIPSLETDERLEIAMLVWLIRGEDRTVLFDAGFHGDEWIERFGVTHHLRPDSAVRRAGVDPAQVTDVIVSHAHWDHMGGIDLFPNATIWIQREEYEYYTGRAWQAGGRTGGIDPANVLALVRRNLDGDVRLVDGDGVEILPGIRAYTGGRHTYASQYIRVAGDPPYVLASDNCYLYRNLEERLPVATFRPEDAAANRAALERMVELAGSPERVVPGHDPALLERFPTEGRITRIR